jgi:hypothetical protein
VSCAARRVTCPEGFCRLIYAVEDEDQEITPTLMGLRKKGQEVKVEVELEVAVEKTMQALVG